MRIDRKEVPPINQIDSIDYLLPEKWNLANGIKVWGINAGSQELIKIDFLFEAGTWYQPGNLVAGLTNAFMNQGSQNYTAQDIAETFDSRGAYLQLSADQQFGTVSILTLNKYLIEIIKVTADVIQNPTFPEKEVAVQIGKKRQQFIIENNKVKTLAQKRFSQVLFGYHHPYANTNAIEDYDDLDSTRFVDFYKKHYTAENCKIIVSGLYNHELKNALEHYFGYNNWAQTSEIEKGSFKPEPSAVRNHFVEKNDALQSAIRIGCLVPNRNHPDYYGLNVLVTLLGGYFGSRLMTNIREDKGYTYGIGAGIYALPNAAYFSIATEVGTEVCQAALHEIYLEIELLQNEMVGEDELEIVKNYLLGETLRSFDGIFAMSNSLKTLIEAGLGYDHYDEFVNVIRNITPKELQRLAQLYFIKENLFEIVAGKNQQQ